MLDKLKKSLTAWMPGAPVQVRYINNPHVLTRIVEHSTNRAKKDIKTWRAALTMAENRINPNRNLYYDLCEDLIHDNHVKNLMKRMNRMVAKNKFIFLKDNDVNEDLTKLLSGKWFTKFIQYAIESRAYGHSLVEFTYENDKLYCQLIPRKHVLPEVGGWRVNPYDTSCFIYRGDPFHEKFLVEIGEPQDLGDLMAAAPSILFKKNATIAWSEYTEVFGMPMRVGKTNSKNVTDLDRMENQMVTMGKAAYAVIDSQEEITFVESTKGDAYQVFDQLIERMNSELSKLFLGETLTTDVGKNGSRSQSEVHQDVSDEVAAELQSWFLNILNEDVIPVLQHLGINVEGHEIAILKKSNTDLATDKWLQSTYKIDPQFFADKYNVPIEEEKEIKELPPVDTNLDNPKDDEEDIKNKLEQIANNPIVRLHADIDKLYNQPHVH